MSKPTEEQTGKRRLVERDGEKYYFFISETDIMFSSPYEGSITNQEKYSMINAICRLASKMRVNGIPWTMVTKQLNDANITSNRTWVRDIAQVIEDNQVE